MKVLRVIGNFFVKIWKWILKTAWIQPLLIVGLLFGIIFSIPPIVDAIKNSGSEDNPIAFLEDRNLSWEGIDRTDSWNSEVEKFTNDVRNAVESSSSIQGGWNQKFFLTFSQTGCSGCTDLSKAMSKLNDLWNKETGFRPTNSSDSFKVYNIQTDYKLDENFKTDTLYTTGVENRDLYAFNTLMLNGSGLPDIIEIAGPRGLDNAFYEAGGVTNQSSYYQSIENMQVSTEGRTFLTSFYTPVVIVFDFTPSGLASSFGTGISQIFFAVQIAKDYQGATGAQQVVRGHAQFLMDAWNGTGAFEYNPK